MKKFPDQIACDVCGAPATVELFDKLANTPFCRCREHQPELRPAAHPNLLLVRYRHSPVNESSKRLASDERSPSHQMFREEMCEMQLLMADGACRYYLSMLTGIDHFALWSDEFLANAVEYVTVMTRGAAKQFVFDCGSIGLVLPFLKAEFYKIRQCEQRPSTKAELAVNYLMRHPGASDVQVAKAVSTTTKQLARFAEYGYLKRCAIK